MGGASPYRARFIALPPCGQNGNSSEGVPCENGEKYFGLTNVANTCYVNSVLQALYFCAPFRRSAIQHLAEEREEDSGGDSLLTVMAELFAQIEGQKRTVGCLTPRRFLAKLRKSNDLFCTSEHQDAHEFMQFLLNDIVEHIKKRLQKQREREKERQRQQNGQAGTPTGANSRQPALGSSAEPEEEPRTWVHDIFQGYLVNQMKCLCCENVTVRRETFLDLSVDIERHTSVAACLRAFESTELLRAGNKFFCDTCACLQEAEKRLRVYQLPSVLTLHLKRFKYIERLGRCCRLPYRVVFPLQLRVVEHRPRGSNGASFQVRSATAEPAEGAALPAEGDEGAQPPSRLFELRSVVVHIGRDSSRGHYVTIVRNGGAAGQSSSSSQRADRCILLDDDVVRVVEPEVLRSFYGTAGTSTSHYHHNGSGHGGGGNQDRADRAHHHPGPSAGGWSGGEAGELGSGRAGGGERFPTSHSPSVPLYERSPEGTCCGYLLFYEAVDGVPDQDSNSLVDVGAAADWISEDRNFSDSESGGESAEDRTFPNNCDDSELTQAFEQRCIPRAAASRQRAPASPSPTATPTAASSPEPWNRERAAAGQGRSPPAAVQPLGAVLPAAGAAEAVSPSRVNVVTVPSPSGSPETGPGGETERA